MSTEIKGAYSPKVHLSIGPSLTPRHVYVSVKGSDGAAVPIAALLSAVEAECDVIIVRRADLPEVDPEVNGHGGLVGDDYLVAESAAEARHWAVHYLAFAEYMEAHPPGDEAQVEAAYDVIQTSLREAGATMGDIDYGFRMAVAQALVADGWAKS